MDVLEENDNRLFLNSITYLHRLSNMASLDIPILKSFYSTKGRLMELRKAMYLPSNITRSSVRCQRCLINFAHGTTNYKVEPELRKNQCRVSFAKRNLLLNWTSQERSSVRKSRDRLLRKGKPRKKDKFCGLNQQVVLSITPKAVKIHKCISDIDADFSDSNTKKTSGFKLSKKRKVVTEKIITMTKQDLKENADKLKKKTKKLNKLTEFLNNSNNSKGNSGNNLKQFLQSL
ncbi:hypothetical protein NQ317_000329 [Molorchus minor]|uniref:Uncharacterized protein n=1 Tax=Molorchus minor TaxID=1323400 RepID=A0ABQ9K109_9CUCU|nr:hypothetical protein NQ317_000329 [Molorchus minor]